MLFCIEITLEDPVSEAFSPILRQMPTNGVKTTPRALARCFLHLGALSPHYYVQIPQKGALGPFCKGFAHNIKDWGPKGPRSCKKPLQEDSGPLKGPGPLQRLFSSRARVFYIYYYKKK